MQDEWRPNHMECVNDLFQPASSDNGTALGAAAIMAGKADIALKNIMPHAYWGPEYSEAEIEHALRESKLQYFKVDNQIEFLCEALEKGQIIGWHNGRSEIGARALGGRSIIANPLFPDMREKLNLEVKHREAWRPFCPSLPKESFERYFGHNLPSDHMIIAYAIKEEFETVLPSAVHVDGTVRAQTVVAQHNPKFHDLLTSFGKRTGHPVLINTSFNIQGEPIVETPANAIRCFAGTGIDIPVIGDFVITKRIIGNAASVTWITLLIKCFFASKMPGCFRVIR